MNKYGLIREFYVEKDLVKVIDNGQIRYYAVDNDTADNMLNVDYQRMNSADLRDIKVEFIGSVLVQQFEDYET